MSPYTPLTRQRWLAFQQAHTETRFDESIEQMRGTPVVPQPAIADTVNRLSKAKAESLQIIERTFAESQPQNLLGTPAVVISDIVSPGNPIF